jgi:hypothetical protein
MAKNAHLQAIISAVDRVSPVLRKVNARMGMMHKTFRDVGSSSRNVLAGIGLPASIGLGALGFGLVSAGKSALDYAGALQDASDNTGMSKKAIQELGAAFEAAGVKQEDFIEKTGKLSKGLAEAAAGKDQSLLGLLTKLRIPLRNAKGEIRSVEEVLPELSDAFAKNVNPAVRSRMAMELFGKSGGKLVAVMMQGGASLAEARKEAERLGAVLSDTDVERLDALGDSFGMLQRQVRVRLAGAFAIAAPAINDATKNLSEWLAKSNVQQKLGDSIKRIADAFSAWVKDGGVDRMLESIDALVTNIGKFVEFVGGWGNVMKGLGVLILAGPVSSLFALGAALVRLGTTLLGQVVPVIKFFGAGLRMLGGPLASLARFFGGSLVSALSLAGRAMLILGRVFLMNPIGLVVTAIAAAAYLIYKNWDEIGPWMKDLWDGIVNTVTAAVDQIIGLIEKLNPLQGLGSSIGGFLADTFIPDPLQQQSPLTRAGALQGAGGGRMQGTVAVRFENAPPGMRVDSQSNNTPGLTLNTDVGYRGTGSIG